MPKIGELTRVKPVTVPVDLGDGDVVSLVFNRNAITPAWMEAAGERDAADDNLSLPKMIADVIVSWDITDDEGGDYPPTGENIAVLSFPSQQALLRRILESAVPGSEEKNATGSTSSTPTPSSSSELASRQNGQEPSSSPSSSASPLPM